MNPTLATYRPQHITQPPKEGLGWVVAAIAAAQAAYGLYASNKAQGAAEDQAAANAAAQEEARRQAAINQRLFDLDAQNASDNKASTLTNIALVGAGFIVVMGTAIVLFKKPKKEVKK